jgi:hypothetical protein
VLVVSCAALYTGVQEARLIASGPLAERTVETLTPGATGWLAVAGCVRHDLALGVTAAGRVYRLGSAPPESEEDDRVFTPLSARDDCDEERPPRRLFALVEDDDALTNTIGHAYRQRVAPPPVLAVVDGVIGFGVGHGRLAAAARKELERGGSAAAELPVLVKGRRPGVRWVALTTAGAGVHGLLLLAVGAAWFRRRQRRAAAGEAGEAARVEAAFFDSPPDDVE